MHITLSLKHAALLAVQGHKLAFKVAGEPVPPWELLKLAMVKMTIATAKSIISKEVLLCLVVLVMLDCVVVSRAAPTVAGWLVRLLPPPQQKFVTEKTMIAMDSSITKPV